MYRNVKNLRSVPWDQFGGQCVVSVERAEWKPTEWERLERPGQASSASHFTCLMFEKKLTWFKPDLSSMECVYGTCSKNVFRNHLNCAQYGTDMSYTCFVPSSFYCLTKSSNNQGEFYVCDSYHISNYLNTILNIETRWVSREAWLRVPLCWSSRNDSEQIW